VLSNWLSAALARRNIHCVWVMVGVTFLTALGHQLGAGVAAFGAGLSRTLLATYLPAFFIARALCSVVALITLAINPVNSSPPST
jgi:hypothetical protein